MSDVITVPGKMRLEAIQAPSVPNASGTAATAVMEFEAVQHLLAKRPLRAPAARPKMLSQDQDDVLAIEAAKQEGGPRSYEELRRELGLLG